MSDNQNTHNNENGTQSGNKPVVTQPPVKKPDTVRNAPGKMPERATTAKNAGDAKRS